MTLLLEGNAAFIERLVEMTATTQRELCILSQTLDRRVYGNEGWLDVLQTFLLSHERARLHVLVHTPSATMRSGHRLIELGRRLSSRVEFRATLPERWALEQEYAVSDERSVLLRGSPTTLEVRYDADAPLLAREQRRAFEALWQESPPAAEFRDLKI